MGDDFEFEQDDGDRRQLDALGDVLRRGRPVPSAAFRGELRRRLISAPARSARPRYLWALVAGSASVGSALLAFAAVGVAGTGPFAV